jgi:hypothetical protein
VIIYTPIFSFSFFSRPDHESVVEEQTLLVYCVSFVVSHLSGVLIAAVTLKMKLANLKNKIEKQMFFVQSFLIELCLFLFVTMMIISVTPNTRGRPIQIHNVIHNVFDYSIATT